MALSKRPQSERLRDDGHAERRTAHQGCDSHSRERRDAPKPLIIGNTALGGADLNAHTPGVTGGVGPNNVGLLVTAYGKVTAAGDTFFYIDDGGSSAGSGVRIETAPAGLAVGDVVAVTGMSSVTSSGGANQRG